MTVFEKIYKVVQTVPKGRVITYGQVAVLAGNRHWARVVGYALHSNPDPKTIPCHRVVMRDGALAPGFVFGGPQAQRNLLELEGIEFDPSGKVDLKKFGLFSDTTQQ